MNWLLFATGTIGVLVLLVKNWGLNKSVYLGAGVFLCFAMGIIHTLRNIPDEKIRTVIIKEIPVKKEEENLSPLYAGGLPGTIPRNMNEYKYVTAPGNSFANRDNTGAPLNWSEVISLEDMARSIRGEVNDVVKYRCVYMNPPSGAIVRWADANDHTNYVDLLPGHSGKLPRGTNFIVVASLTEEPQQMGVRLVMLDKYRVP